MTAITISIFILALLLTIAGLIGAIVPALPGPPLSLAGLALIYWFFPGSISTSLLITMIILTVVAAALDYLAPILLTRVGGGSKQAVFFTTLGLVAGLFFMPFGIFLGPFLGALAGELLAGKRFGASMKGAFGAFLGFLFGIVLKFVCCGLLAYLFWRSLP